MKKILFALFLSVSVLFSYAGVANAITYTSYTDYAAWSSAAGATTIEDFTGETTGSFISRDFGDFDAQLFNQSASYLPEIVNEELRIQRWNSNSYLQIEFDDNIQSLGFDWRNTDNSSDSIELIIGGDIWDFGPSQSSGFFGLIASGGTFDTVAFSDSAGNGGALGYGYIDNIEYAVVSNPVPEPSTYILLGTGIAGLIVWRRKRKLKG